MLIRWPCTRVETPTEPAPPSITRILHVVGEDYGVPPSVILGFSRHHEAARARHVSMYLARELLDASYKQLGASFGRDHSTVIYGYSRIAKESRADPDLRTRLRTLAAALS